MFKILKTTLIAIIGWLLVVVPLYGGTTGKIAGRVVDKESGEPLPGVNVIIEGTAWGASTDLEGYYFIINIPPGVYSLRASMMGYEQMKVTHAKVSVDLTTKINFGLASTVLDLGEEIIVTAEKPLVQKDATAQMASIDGATIAEKLPVADVDDVLAMQAGFSRDHQGKLHVAVVVSEKLLIWSMGSMFQIHLSIPFPSSLAAQLRVPMPWPNCRY